MIVRGREFTDIYDLVGIRVLVETERDCYATLGVIHANWQPVPGPVQGLHRDAEVQHVPVAAHDGDRPGRQAGRAADPHPRHAPHGRVRHRRALEVQGEQERSRRRAGRRCPTRWAGCGSCSTGSARPRSPRSSSTRCASTCGANEVYVFTPKGDVIALPAGVDAGRLRLRRAHRGRPPLHRRAGQRQAGRAGERARQRRHRRGLHLQGRERRAVPRLAGVRQVAAGPRPRSGSGSPRSAARTRSRRARPRSSKAMRKAALPLQRLLGGDALLTLAQDMHLADVSALYAAIGEGHVSAQSVVQKLVAQLGGPEGAVEDIAEAVDPVRDVADRALAAPGDAGRHGQGRQRRVGEARPLLHAGARRRHPRLRHPRRRRLGAPHEPAPTRDRCSTQPERLVEVEWAPSADSVFVVSIQVEALDRHRSALRRHPGAVRRAGQHPVGARSAPTATGSRSAGSPSRWPRRSTSGHLLRAIRNVEGVYDVYRVHADAAERRGTIVAVHFVATVVIDDRAASALPSPSPRRPNPWPPPSVDDVRARLVTLPEHRVRLRAQAVRWSPCRR